MVMYIKAESLEGVVSYINTAYYTRFTVEAASVEAWSSDNLTISLKKTKELKEQLDSLCGTKTSKGLEKFG